jgi:transcriptional regulator with XRE-family HTH domain
MQKLRPDMDIGNAIQKIRLQKKLTQEQVIAQMQLMGIEITRSTFAKLETNRMNIKVSELVALSKILNVDFNAFFQDLV